MADREGLKTALGGITDDQLGELMKIGRDRQMMLLPLAEDFDPEETDEARAKRGVGRPKGALNKTTQWWRDYLIGKHGSPIERLAEIYARPVGLLAKEIGCTPFEALKLQILAAKELAPYVHQKLPVQVDLGEKGLVNLTIVLDAANARLGGRQDAGEGFTIDITPVIENATKSEG